MPTARQLKMSLPVIFSALLCACSSAGMSGSSNTKTSPKPPAPTQAQAPGQTAPAASAPASTDASAAAPVPTSTAANPPAPASPPAPGTAVQKGSFTVWAIPPNPKQDEDYQIFIRVALPASTTGYLQSDLSGQLVGTDNYRQSIQSSFRVGEDGELPAALSFVPTATDATLAVWVPGAERHVQDTVTVSSKLLGESQTLTIQFH